MNIHRFRKMLDLVKVVVVEVLVVEVLVVEVLVVEVLVVVVLVVVVLGAEALLSEEELGHLAVEQRLRLMLIESLPQASID